ANRIESDFQETHRTCTNCLSGCSEDELQHKLHRSWIGLDVGNATEAASGLMHPVSSAVGKLRQTEVGVRDAQVLVVEGIKHLPPDLGLPLLREMERSG